MTAVPDWLTVKEVAAWMSVPVEAVREEIRSGTMPAREVGGHVRISRDRLLAQTGGQSPALMPDAGPSLKSLSPDRGIPQPAGLVWLENLEPAEKFVYGW